LEEALRVIEACEPDFGMMVKAALMTGCRWGELCNLQVKDFDGRAKLLTVKQEKTGKLKYVALTDEDIKFFSENAFSKTGSDLIFTKMDGSRWRKSDQQLRMAEAVESANVKERITFHGLRHTVGRWLAEQNLPMAIIAKHLGHSNSRVTEEFYAHYSPSHIQDTIRANKPSLTRQADPWLKQHAISGLLNSTPTASSELPLF
jgi:integrase